MPATDHVIDTNVLIVASGGYGEQADDPEPPSTERARVRDWVEEFRAETSRSIVLDAPTTILDEYRRNLRPQSLGMALWITCSSESRVRVVDIALDRDRDAIVPESFLGLSRGDRKFLAVALNDNGRSSIVNATDSDWFAIEEQLRDAGIELLSLVDPWLREQPKSRAILERRHPQR